MVNNDPVIIFHYDLLNNKSHHLLKHIPKTAERIEKRQPAPRHKAGSLIARATDDGDLPATNV